MNTTKLIVSGAIAGLVSLATSGAALAEDKGAGKEKCYGIAKKAPTIAVPPSIRVQARLLPTVLPKNGNSWRRAPANR